MKRDIYVFVYGTLRFGESNHQLLKHAVMVSSQCWTYGVLFDTGHGYPAVKQASNKKVYGELYLIHKDELKQLDSLEDFEEGRQDNLYNRIKQTIYTNDESIVAYLYVANQESILRTQISSGDWIQFRR